MSKWKFSLLSITVAAFWSVQAATITSFNEVENNDGLLSIPIVGIDRKTANLPQWGFQKADAEQVSSFKVPLENIDLAYLMNVSIGTPPQPFTLLLDTGSSTTWVPLEGCGESCGNPPHTLSPKASSTFEQTDMLFGIRYGQGFSRGFYGKDTFTFNGNFSVPNTEFAVSNMNDGELTSDGADGIVGIGPDALSKYNNPDNVVVPTLVTSMKNAGMIKNSTFSVYFKSIDEAERSNTRVNGDIVFGGVDLSKVENNTIKYIPITTNENYKDYWAVDIHKITVDGNETNYEAGLPTLVDTGSTLIFLPQEIVISVMSKVRGLSVDYWGQYLVPCDTPDLVPITFTMGSHEFTINPQEYIVPYSVGGAFYNSVEYCYTYLYEAPSFVDSILGYGFLQQFVSVYDDDNKRLGLGRVAR